MRRTDKAIWDDIRVRYHFPSRREKYDKQGNIIQLNLSDLSLSQIPAELGNLSQLQSLFLDNNQLTEIPAELGNLSQLQSLFLDNNQLTEIPAELGNLSQLQSLFLDNNRLTEIPAELGNLERATISLAGNPDLTTPPPEIIEQGSAEILAFLHELHRSGFRRYEAKLLLVGEGSTGKSSLLRSLLGLKFDPSLPTTHGITIESLTIAQPSLLSTEMTLNIWDFGGQDIYRATHQFFLTQRSLYIVVWNARENHEQGRLDYWLETIRVLAPHAPILVVATHRDQRQADLNERLFQHKYPQIVKFLSVSNQTGEGIDPLKQELTVQAARLPLMGQQWPQRWYDIEKALLSRSEHHIKADTYIQICASHGSSAALAQGSLGSYLHDLGKILYFRDDTILDHIVILKPNWITKAISFVLESANVRRDMGILTHHDLPEIWARDEDGQPYARSLYPIFLRLMERFDLSYQIEPAIPGHATTHSLVPQLLPYQEPNHLYVIPDDQARVEMIYQFDFVPAGVMSWLIVRTHRYTLGRHWRDGAILHYRDHYARIELTPPRLTMTVWGTEPHTFFVILKETLELILRRFEGLRVKRLIPCICHRQTHASSACPQRYQEENLVRFISEQQSNIQCHESGKKVSVVELLYGIHISTKLQVLQTLAQGQDELLHRVRTIDTRQQQDHLLLQRINQLSEWNVRNFTRLWNLEMRKLENECPNTFVLIPGSRSRFNPKYWISEPYKLHLLCQHPQGPHRVKEKYAYDIHQPRNWWLKVSPWLKYMVEFLKYSTPLVGPIGNLIDPDDVKQFEQQIGLLERITEDMTEIVESDGYAMRQREFSASEEGVGPALRALYSFLNEVDPQKVWGGLRRIVTDDGNILWLCEEHAQPYIPRRLQL